MAANITTTITTEATALVAGSLVLLGSADARIESVVVADKERMSMCAGEVAVQYNVDGEGPFFHTFPAGAVVRQLVTVWQETAA